MERYDPIQRVVNWQLRSRMPTDCGDGLVSRHDTKKEIEDRLIAAIQESDETETRNMRIYRLYCEYGYKQVEIGEMEGLSFQQISKILKKVAQEGEKQG